MALDPNTITKVAKEAGRNTGRNIGKIKQRDWVKLDMSVWALLEQIRTHPSHPTFEGVNETMTYCIRKVGRALELEVG